jgi:FKBP-type peptidyl-prolyl cis-trans isomerase SlyD
MTSVVAGKQVTLMLKMYDGEGDLVTDSDDPISYVHGRGEIFPLLERALEGMDVGKSISVYLQPEDHFGEYDAELVRIESRSALPADLEVGMQFEAHPEPGDEDDEDGASPSIVTVTEIEGDTVVLDGNHPLAGIALRFDMTVQGIEDAEPLQEDDDDEVHFRQLRRSLH